MTVLFFHADPHPGNMKWWKDKIYFLDLGCRARSMRCQLILMLLLLAFSQRDAKS